MDISDIEDTYVYNIRQCYSNAGTLQTQFTIALSNLPWKPEFAILREVHSQSSLTTDGNIYTLQEQNISPVGMLCTFPLRASFSPQTVFALKKPFQNLQFQINQIDTASGGGVLPVSAIANSAFLSIQLEFVKMRPKVKAPGDSLTVRAPV